MSHRRPFFQEALCPACRRVVAVDGRGQMARHSTTPRQPGRYVRRTWCQNRTVPAEGLRPRPLGYTSDQVHRIRDPLVKVCTVCHELKLRTEFSPGKGKCKPCYARIYREQIHRWRREAVPA